MTDDREDKTLEVQEHFTEVAKSRDVEVRSYTISTLAFKNTKSNISKLDRSTDEDNFFFVSIYRFLKENHISLNLEETLFQ